MNLNFRNAKAEDIPALVNLLFDDEFGTTREDNSVPLNQRYSDAFKHIENDSNNELTVVESNGNLSGMLQLTFIPYLRHLGSWRCLIEGVRIHKNYRGQGLGARFIKWAINRAKKRKCSIVQLTSDKQRTHALRFYQSLGFEATHEGFKLRLNR